MRKAFLNFSPSRSERKQLMKQRGASLKKLNNNFIILLAVTRPRKIKGKLGFDLNTSDNSFLVKSRNIYDALDLNTGGYYTTAFADMPLLDTRIDDFEEAIDNMGFVLGDEGAKTAAKGLLKETLDDALIYVNKICRNNQTFAVEIITGAKMEVAKSGNFEKPDFEVKQGNGTGTIDLISKAVKIDGHYVSTTYYWQFSIDNGKTWENLEETQVANTTATGMLVNIPTIFRKRTRTTKGGLSAWCAPLGITPE